MTALLILGASAAHAGEPDAVDQARASFNVGARAYAAGQFNDAVRAFEQAYKLTPREGLLFSLAQAHRKQYYVDKKPEDLRAALKYYREYVGRVAQGGRRAEAADALAELEPRAAALETGAVAPAVAPESKPVTQLMISSPTRGVRLQLDGRDAGKLPFVSDITAGKHRVRLSAPGYEDYVREIGVRGGSVVPLDVPLVDKPGRVSVSAPAGARISIDGKEIGAAPQPPFQVPHGRHFVAVTANGRQPFGREIEVQRGQAKRLDVALETTTQRTVAWVFLGGGAAGWVSSSVLAWAAQRKQDDARAILDRRERKNISMTELGAYSTLRGQRDDYRTVSIVAAAAGTGLAATGLVLFVFDEPRPQAPSETRERRPGAPGTTQPGATMEVSAAPLWGPEFGGAALTGRF